MTHDHPQRTPSGPDPRDLTGPFRHEVQTAVRFADTDAMGHVNNAVYLTFCEMGRIGYWTDVTGEPMGHGTEPAESIILAEARITYRAPIFYGDSVTIQTRASRIGRSSFTLEHRLSAAPAAPAGGAPRLVAVSDSVIVRYDYAGEVAIPLSVAQIAAIESYEGRSLRG